MTFVCSFLWNREYYLHRCEIILHEQRVESCAGLVNLHGLWACICGRMREPTELHVQIRCGRRLNGWTFLCGKLNDDAMHRFFKVWPSWSSRHFERLQLLRLNNAMVIKRGFSAGVSNSTCSVVHMKTYKVTCGPNYKADLTTAIHELTRISFCILISCENYNELYRQNISSRHYVCINHF